MKYMIQARRFRRGAFVTRLILILILTPFCAALAGEWPQPPSSTVPSEADLARLEAGEILVSNTRVDEAGGAAVAKAIFHVDAPRLWDILGDCEENYRFVRGLRDCEVLRESATAALTRQSLKPYLLLPHFSYVFDTRRAPYEWIQIRLQEGDLRILEGSWRFDPLPGDGGILVTHAIRVQPKMSVPRWLARRTVERDLYRMLACLRWRTSAWPDPGQGEIDQQQCPD